MVEPGINLPFHTHLHLPPSSFDTDLCSDLAAPWVMRAQPAVESLIDHLLVFINALGLPPLLQPGEQD